MNKSLLLLVSIGLLLHASAKGQQNIQLGSFDFLPQSVYANPALVPKARLNIAIPALGHTYVAHQNNWFEPSAFVSEDANGRTQLKPEGIVNNIDGFARMGQEVSLELFHVGLKIDKHYFHVSATERLQIGLKLPRDIFALAVYGNTGNAQFENNTANFSGLGINGIHYREYALGYNYSLEEKWTFGIRAKYLYGMERIKTEQSSLKLRTDPETFDLQSQGSFRVNTSGIYGLASDSSDAVQDDLKNYLLGLKNSGFGADLGLTYRPIEKLELQFSANDIGFIKWKSDVANYGTDDASFAYDGVDLTGFIFDSELDFNDELENEVDTLLDDLENAYGFDRTNEEFTTALNGYLRYGASYQLVNAGFGKGKVWANALHGVLDSPVPFTFSVGYNQTFWNALQAGLHYSKRKGYTGFFGAGLSANAGPVQLYALAENIRFANLTRITVVDSDNPEDESSLVYFSKPGDMRITVGLNLTFGREAKPAGRPMTR
jgi:hypothetical protein